MNLRDEAKRLEALMDKALAEWADKGKIIEGGWQAFLVSGGARLPADQQYDMRRGYYMGAQHLYASIIRMLDPGSEPTERDLERMSKIHDELEAYHRSLLQ